MDLHLRHMPKATNNAPVRICFPFVGDSFGGSHVSSLILIENLNATLFKPEVVLHEKGPMVEHLQSRGIPFHFLPLTGYVGSSPKTGKNLGALRQNSLTIAKFIRRERIDIVHTNDLRMHLSWPLATRSCGRKFINHQRMLLSQAKVWRFLFMLPSRIICISEAVYNSLPANGQRKAVVVPNPVDERAVPTDKAKARMDLLQRLGLPEDTILVGYVGNMMKQKRPLVFLRACKLIADELGENVHFVMAGDNRGRELDSAILLAQQLELSNRTHFLGFNSPIEPIISAFDILIAPGVNDAFGRTIAEAMICRVPVVASASGGHVELLKGGQFGLLGMPDDHISLANCGLNFLKEPDFTARIVEAAYEKARHVYAPTRHAANITDIYCDLLGLPRSAANLKSDRHEI